MPGRGEEILRLAASGLTDRQIAEKLSISVRTVEGHWKRLREKTGLPNRSGLLGWMLEQRLEEERRRLSRTEPETSYAPSAPTHAVVGGIHAPEEDHRLRSRLLSDELTALYKEVAEWRTKAEQAHSLNTIVAQSNVVAWRITGTPPHRCTYMAESVRQFGYEPEEFTRGIGTVAMLIHPEDYTTVLTDGMMAVRRGQTSLDRRYRVVTASGDIRWVFDRTVVEMDESGTRPTLATFAIDITHLQGHITAAVTHYLADAR